MYEIFSFLYSVKISLFGFILSYLYGFLAVILSDYYDLPFNDILDWRKFSVIVKERDVYQLKQILKDISDIEFIKLHKNLMQVRYFFFLHYSFVNT